MKLISLFKTFLFYLKPRKIVAQYKLFFGDEWLEGSVDSIAPSVHKILFVISDIAWGDDFSNPKIKGDNLEAIVQKLVNKYPQKIIIQKGSWNAQKQHVQAGLDYIKNNIPEATHCLYIDGDEIYAEKEIKKLKKILFDPRYFNRAIRIQYNLYFKTIYNKVTPQKWPTALALFPIRSYVHYLSERNNVTCKIIDFEHIKYEHPAYVRKDDEKMRLKIEAHRETESIIGDWYNEVWLKWTPDFTNFHPTNPITWEKVSPTNLDELPEAMIRIFNENFSQNA